MRSKAPPGASEKFALFNFAVHAVRLAMYDRLASKLRRRADQHLLRELAPAQGIDFTSNDFLGLANAPEIRRAVYQALDDGLATGAGGSRLLRGNHPLHQSLEKRAAEFFKCEKALYFANGYSANFALLTALPARHDLVVYDAAAHASIREGLVKSPAKAVRFPHNDTAAMEQIVSRWRQDNAAARQAWIVVESLYSMDGDCAPLAEMFAVAERYGCIMMVDEAHATGVWGAQGKGFTEPFAQREDLIALHTCGKALGASGGLVCAPAVVVDYLINFSRPFIYSTAPSPLAAAAVAAALDLIDGDPSRRLDLRRRIQFAADEFERHFGRKTSGTQIIPFILGDADQAQQAAAQLQRSGFDVRAIRPPTVPAGTSRLRFSITLHAPETSIRALFAALASIATAHPASSDSETQSCKSNI